MIPPKPLIELYVSKWEIQRLLRAQKALEDLQATEGWQVIEWLLRESREATFHSLSMGKTLSAEDYARAMGQIAVLEQIADLPGTITTLARKKEAKAQEHAEQAAKVKA